MNTFGRFFSYHSRPDNVINYTNFNSSDYYNTDNYHNHVCYNSDNSTTNDDNNNETHDINTYQDKNNTQEINTIANRYSYSAIAIRSRNRNCGDDDIRCSGCKKKINFHFEEFGNNSRFL